MGGLAVAGARHGSRGNESDAQVRAEAQDRSA